MKQLVTSHPRPGERGTSESMVSSAQLISSILHSQGSPAWNAPATIKVSLLTAIDGDHDNPHRHIYVPCSQELIYQANTNRPPVYDNFSQHQQPTDTRLLQMLG